ncbi:unnamed protein product [Protopolystoma xenopodis]|uniref:Uncharacterized protein n=1 Tax=Protopolystoma xenopodis TaxID=117903 RepID=A0A448XKX3_9PLAT|nr:unnamed protein product [Protopolystoma xenopodis]
MKSGPGASRNAIFAMSNKSDLANQASEAEVRSGSFDAKKSAFASGPAEAWGRPEVGPLATLPQPAPMGLDEDDDPMSLEQVTAATASATKDPPTASQSLRFTGAMRRRFLTWRPSDHRNTTTVVEGKQDGVAITGSGSSQTIVAPPPETTVGAEGWPYRTPQKSCLGLFSVELCEEYLGLPSCDPDNSVLSFRPSCDGYRQSQKPLFTKNHQIEKGLPAEILLISYTSLYDLSHFET